MVFAPFFFNGPIEIRFPSGKNIFFFARRLSLVDFPIKKTRKKKKEGEKGGKKRREIEIDRTREEEYRISRLLYHKTILFLSRLGQIQYRPTEVGTSIAINSQAWMASHP
jgi:hypothetical protein